MVLVAEPAQNHDMTQRGTGTRLAFLLGALVLAAGCSSGSKSAPASTSSTRKPTRTSSTTTAPATTAPPTAAPTTAPATDTAVWPFVSSTTRYHDPVAAASGFAVTYLGFVAPVIGAFVQGDSRSGEVPIRATTTGPVTTIIVRQLGSDGTWWVLGASTPNLQLQSPVTSASISSPVTLSGRSTAFEATVNVEIRQDGTTTPLATDYVMGGSNGEMGPFSKPVTFGSPSTSSGAIVLKTMSSESGNILEASVIRVRLS